MISIKFQIPTWYRALRLKERFALLDAVQLKKNTVNIDQNLTDFRIKQWKDQAPFSSGDWFQRRLSVNGITPEIFRCLLGEPIDAVQQRSTSTSNWLKDFTQAYTFQQNTGRKAFDFLFKGKDILDNPKLNLVRQTQKFLNLVEPFIRQERSKLHQSLMLIKQKHSNAFFELEQIEEILIANLSVELMSRITRTLVLELNVARLRGVLKGETPTERFESFTQLLTDHEYALSILQEYPVLARQVY
jgi:hypothetical protein